MKRLKIPGLIVSISFLALTACKKDHTCTCITTVIGASATKTYDLPNQTKKDATEACDRFEKDANDTGIGTTNCNL